MGKTYKDGRDHRPKDIIREPKIVNDRVLDGDHEESWTPEAKRYSKRLARRARRRNEKTYADDE